MGLIHRFVPYLCLFVDDGLVLKITYKSELE